MCIPHGASISKDNGYVEKKPKKHIAKVSQDIFEKGDPNFVDERVEKDEPKSKKSIFGSLFRKVN